MAVKEAAHYVDENDWSHRTPFVIVNTDNGPKFHVADPGMDHRELWKEVLLEGANPELSAIVQPQMTDGKKWSDVVSQGEIAHGAYDGEDFLEVHPPGQWVDRSEWPGLEKDIKAKYLENWNRNPVKDVRFYREAMINNAIEEAMTQFKVASKNPSKFHTTTEEHLKSLKKRGPLKTHQKHRKSWSETDRWVECNQGHTHWGANGAAGLLIRHTDPQGVNRYLLQHRGGDVQDAGTWSIPGGALDYGESPEQGALREAQEELGPFNAKIQGVHHVNDHGNWAYHTVAAQAPEMFHPAGDQWEHGNHAWVTPQEMQQLPLHPGFAEFMNHGTLSSVKVSAIDPLDLQNHIAVHGPYLYHSTAPENVSSILRDGILPKEVTGVDYYGTHQPELSSRPNHAYIGDRQTVSGHLGPVLKIDLRKLDSGLINTDEDYMQFKPKMTVPHPSELPDYDRIQSWNEVKARDFQSGASDEEYPTLGEFAENYSHIIDHPEWVKNSLANGSVAVAGGVPADAISLNEDYENHPFDLYNNTQHTMSPTDFYNNPSWQVQDMLENPAKLRQLQYEYRHQIHGAAKHEGAMVALFIPDAEAKKLHIEGGENADQLHITLAFFEDEGADRDDWDEAVKIIKRIAEEFPPLEGEITGTGRFQTDDSEPFIGLVSIHGINALHDKLTIALSDAGFDISTKFAYNPHITLKYEDAGDPDPPFDADLPMKIRFEKMTLTVADERTEVDFNSKASVDLSQPILASRNDNTRAEKSRLSKFASFGCRNCGGQEFGMAGQCRECKKFTFTAALTFAEEETPDMLSGGKAYKYLYAVQDGQKVGFIHFIVDKAGNGKIIKIEVPPEYQRQGIGTALFTELSREYPGVQHSNDLTDAGAAWKQSLGAEKDPDYLFAYYNTGLKVEEWHHNLRYRNILEDLLHEYESDIDYTGWEDNENLWTGGEIYESPFRIEFKQLSLPEVQEAAEAAIREYFDKKQLEEYEKYIAPQWLEQIESATNIQIDDLGNDPHYNEDWTPKAFYHQAPTSERARILQHGLYPSKPGISPNWEHELGQGTGVEDQPEAIYAWAHPPGEAEGGELSEFGKPTDTWIIPAEQVHDYDEDPLLGYDGAYHINHPVRPQLYRRHEDKPHVMDTHGDEAHMWNIDNWQADSPYEDERKEMGIGWPDRVIGKTATWHEAKNQEFWYKPVVPKYRGEVASYVMCPNCKASGVGADMLGREVDKPVKWTDSDEDCQRCGASSGTAKTAAVEQWPIEKALAAWDRNMGTPEKLYQMSGPYLDKMKDHMSQVGFWEPIQMGQYANGDPVIEDGHHKLWSALQLGMTHVPVEQQPPKFTVPGQQLPFPGISASWDQSGDEPRWIQPHEELLADALHSWKGDPSSMSIHMYDALHDPTHVPAAGSGKMMRAQAEALLREIQENSKPNPVRLYRGSHIAPVGHQAWSENRATANLFAKKNGGQVYTLEPGQGRGIRVADYIRSGADDSEREWIIDHSARIAKKSMALTPNQWENWKKSTGGKLYHYTNPENVDKILQEGIRPWDDVGYSMYENPANRDLLPRPGHTYMTTYPRESYYFDKDFKEGWHKPIFEIDMNKLDPQMVNMDEDHAKYYMDSEHPAWEPYWNTQDNPDKSLGGIIQEHKDYFDKPIMVNNSLQHGSIAYQGKIPPEAIKLHRPATKMSSTWF